MLIMSNNDHSIFRRYNVDFFTLTYFDFTMARSQWHLTGTLFYWVSQHHRFFWDSCTTAIIFSSKLWNSLYNWTFSCTGNKWVFKSSDALWITHKFKWVSFTDIVLPIFQAYTPISFQFFIFSLDIVKTFKIASEICSCSLHISNLADY